MKIQQVTKHGNPRWRVDFGLIDGKRKVNFFKTEKEAELAANRSERDQKKIGDRWADLSPANRGEVVKILGEVKDAGLTLAQVWTAYKTDKLTPVDEAHSRTLRQVINELEPAKRASNKSSDYIKGLISYLNQFASGRDSMPISKIGVKQIEEWFSSRHGVESPITRASNLGRISSLFSMCVRRGYLKENPCDRIERVTLFKKPATTLTQRQILKALAYSRRSVPKFLGWVSLALLCGLRPEEAEQMTWENIDLRSGKVRVDAATTKVRHRRIVDVLKLNPVALDWLRIAKSAGAVLPLAEITKKRYLHRVRDKLGFKKWPQDVCRHTAASYLLGKGSAPSLHGHCF